MTEILIQVALTGFVSISTAVVGMKVAINGMKEDVREIRADVKTLRDGQVQLGLHVAVLDTRLAHMEKGP